MKRNDFMMELKHKKHVNKSNYQKNTVIPDNNIDYGVRP